MATWKVCSNCDHYRDGRCYAQPPERQPAPAITMHPPKVEAEGRACNCWVAFRGPYPRESTETTEQSE